MGGWVGGVRKWQFLMFYSTVNHQRGGWVQKSQKHDEVILEWSLKFHDDVITSDKVTFHHHQKIKTSFY